MIISVNGLQCQDNFHISRRQSAMMSPDPEYFITLDLNTITDDICGMCPFALLFSICDAYGISNFVDLVLVLI